MASDPTRPNEAQVPPDFTEGTANVLERVIDGAVGKVLNHVDARTVYGEPFKEGDRTVIPVAKVASAYGFGIGSGQGSGEDNSQGTGLGGGGGGKIDAKPVGYIEVTPTETKFVPIVDGGAIALRVVTLMGIAAIIGVLFASRNSGRDG